MPRTEVVSCELAVDLDQRALGRCHMCPVGPLAEVGAAGGDITGLIWGSGPVVAGEVPVMCCLAVWLKWHVD